MHYDERRGKWVDAPAPTRARKGASARRYHYVTNCVSSDGDSIQEMQSAAETVSFSEFSRNVTELKEFARGLGYDSMSGSKGLSLANDYANTFNKSVYRGVACYYVRQSGIEYIFTLNGVCPVRDARANRARKRR